MGKGGGTPKAQALEPLKSAEQSMNEAADATGRAQQLRRGLASTFSRPGMGGQPAAAGSATSGAARRLGG